MNKELLQLAMKGVNNMKYTKEYCKECIKMIDNFCDGKTVKQLIELMHLNWQGGTIHDIKHVMLKRLTNINSQSYELCQWH